MHDEARRVLVELVAERGIEPLARDAGACRAFLLDLLPSARPEVSVLVAAVEEGIPDALIDLPAPQVRVDSLTARLVDQRGLDATAARWAVETWLHAVSPAAISTPPASPPTPVVPPPPPAPSTEPSGPVRAPSSGGGGRLGGPALRPPGAPSDPERVPHGGSRFVSHGGQDPVSEHDGSRRGQRPDRDPAGQPDERSGRPSRRWLWLGVGVVAVLLLGTIGWWLTAIVDGEEAAGTVIDFGSGVPTGWTTASSLGGLIEVGVPPGWESGGEGRHQIVAPDIEAWRSEYTRSQGPDAAHQGGEDGIRFTATEVGVGVWVADSPRSAPVTADELQRLTEEAFVPVGCEAGPAGAVGSDHDLQGVLIGWYTRESECEGGFLYGQQYLAHPSNDRVIVRIEYVDDDDDSEASTNGVYWSILIDLGAWDELDQQDDG